MNRVCSIFSQILQLIPRPEFEASVQEHKAERHARGFSSWTQLIAMLFCQLGQAQSLREITGGLAASEGKLRHLGVEEPPKRSTLSYANAHRPWQLYEGVFYKVLATCQAEAKNHKRKFRFRARYRRGPPAGRHRRLPRSSLRPASCDQLGIASRTRWFGGVVVLRWLRWSYHRVGQTFPAMVVMIPAGEILR